MQTHTILVVEPAEHFRAAIRRSLQQSGYRVLESTTGAGALTLAAAQRPNLILMDVELPDGDGLEVAQELRRRQETSRIPIVVLSGEGALGQRAALIAAFCAGSIPKSVALERLERDLRLLLSMARTYVPRRFLRYPVEIPAFYRRKAEASTGEEEAGAGIVRTLSEGGARFDLPNPMPAATILDLRLQTPGGEVSTAGKVVYSRHRVDKKAVREKEGVHFGFGFAVPDAQVRLDVGWAVIRPNEDQIPASCRNWFSVQRFVDVSNANYGVTLATLDAPMVEIGQITGRLIGSPSDPTEYLFSNPKAWMDRALESPTIYSFVMNNHWGTNYRADQEGLVEFRYSIRPHGAYSPLEAVRFGVQCSQPLLATIASEPASTEPRLTVMPAGVIVTSLRPSREGKAMIARLYGASGRAEQATIRWAAPVPKAVWVSDLSERPLQAVAETVDVPAWGVVTLRADLPE